MKNFINKTVVFSIPILILILIPSLFLFKSGEYFNNLDHIIISGRNYQIGYAYDEGNYKYLKHKELENKNQSAVIALGSSRVLQFRDKMFTKDFYNAGQTIYTITDFVPFIESNMKNEKPEVLLIGLDQWMFNKNWDEKANHDRTNTLKHTSLKYFPSTSTFFKVWADLISGKYGIEVLFPNSDSTESKYGLNSILNNKGFRKDGSMNYGDHIHKLLRKDSTIPDFDYLETYSRIKNGNRKFEFGKKVSEKSIQSLNDLLLFCKNKDIYVVAILPPFANGVNSKMQQSANYTYMDSIYDKSNKIFKQYNFEVWDMTNLNKYHSNDNETIDGFHGSEVSYLKMLIYMVENGSKLRNYTNLQKLKADLSNKQNRYSVYPN